MYGCRARQRANLFSDYTLGVWQDEQLVPWLTYSGLTRSEMEAVDKWIKANTPERFGQYVRFRPSWCLSLGLRA